MGWRPKVAQNLPSIEIGCRVLYLPLPEKQENETEEGDDAPIGTAAKAMRSVDTASLSNETKWLRMLQERNHEVLDSVFEEMPARPVEHILNPQERAYEAHRLEQKDLVTNIRCFSPLKNSDHYQSGDALFDISELIKRSNKLEQRIGKQREVLEEATVGRRAKPRLAK